MKTDPFHLHQSKARDVDPPLSPVSAPKHVDLLLADCLIFSLHIFTPCLAIVGIVGSL